MPRSHRFRSFFVLSFLVTAGTAFADVPRQVSYQGQLRDSSGALVTDTLSMRFRLYSEATGGDLLFDETHPAVSVAEGLFQVLIGTIAPGGVADSILDRTGVYLSVAVADGAESVDRVRLVGVPYSFKTKSAEQLVRPGTVDTAVLVDSTGNVGIGTATPQGKLDVKGPLAVDGDVGQAGQLLASQGPGVAPDWTTPTTGGGQTMYDAIVATSGGDYTDVASSLEAGASSILVRRGTYTLSAAISITSSNVLIQGEEIGGTILRVQNGAAVDGISISGAGGAIENVVIRNLTLDGNKINAGSQAGIRIGQSVSKFRLEGLRIQSFGDYGIFTQGNSGGAGVREGYIVGNAVHDNGQSYPDGGIRLNAFHENLIVAYNHVYANRDDGIMGDEPGANLLVKGNHVRQNNARGIRVSSEATIVTDNQIYENKGEGIFLNRARNILANNFLKNNNLQSSATYRAEIGLFGANCVVNGNVIYIQGAIRSDYGIYEGDGNGYNTVVGNNCASATTQNYRPRADGGSVFANNFGG